MNKVIYLLLLVSGLCYGLESFHHYTYKYRGSFVTSIPEDGEQRSGWRMDALVHVFLENEDGIALFKLSNVRSGVFNEDPLEGETPFHDDVINDEEEELHLSKALEEPFRANLRTSHPFAMEYKKTDPGWVANVRKGIVSMFRNEILNGNYETQVEDSVSKVFHQGHLLNTFKVKEETIFGICTTNYQIHKIPAMVLPNNEDLIPTSDEDNKDLWRLDRSIDFDDCSDIVSTHIHTTNNVKYKDQKPRFQRYSHSTYILTGSPGHFDLYSTMTEGSTVFPLSFFSEQEAESVVKQKLVFVDHNTHDFPTLGQDLQHSRTWMYEVLSSSPAPNVDNELHPWIVHPDKDNEVFDYETYGMSKLSPDQIAASKVSILDLVKEASLMLRDMNQETKETNKKQSISEMLQNAAFHFRFLKKEDVLKIFDHFYENKDTFEMNLAFDAALSSGFPEPMEAIMDYITANRLDNRQISLIFAMLTRNSYGSLNTARMMDYLLEQELSPLHLNFAHYLSEFCIHKVHNHIPTDEGAACGSSLITERFIPYLKNIIYNDTLTWERAFGVKILGVVRSRLAFEILSSFIDGSINSSFPLKVMSIRALEKWSINPEDPLRNSVTDLLTDVYTDVSQNFHVRAAALRALISWVPSSDFWFSLALSTWKEPSGQFVAFVSSLIKVYAEGKPPVNHLQSERAAFAYKYVKHSKSSSIESVRFDESFDREVRLSLHFSQQRIRYGRQGDTELFLSLFADNDELFKLESEILYFEKENPQIKPFNTDRLEPPQAKEFIDKLLREIHLLQIPENVKPIYKMFTKVVNDVFNVESSFFDGRGGDKMSFYLQMMDKSDFHPNELGLPTIVHSSWPTVLSMNIEYKSPTSPPHLASFQNLLRVSSTYSKGISVLLPWNKRFSTAMVRSNMEITLPIEITIKRVIGKEVYLKIESKSALEIFYQKKFPLFRISNTPMTMIYELIPKGKTPILSTKVVRKVDLKTISKGAIEPVTGIRFDIEASAETRTRFGLFSFLQFPKMPFRVWSFDFYMNLEESETEELSIIYSGGKLVNKDGEKSSSESTEDNSQEDSEENDVITSDDSFEERSRKLRKQLGGDVVYEDYKLLFTGKEKTRKYEIFFANNIDKLPDSLYKKQRKTMHTIGIISDTHPLLCINFGSLNYMSPARNPLLSSEVLGPNVPIEFFQFKMLRECYETILQFNVTFELTEEKLREMKKYCKNTYDEENCYLTKDELPDFDVVKVFLRNQEKLYTGTDLDDIMLQSPELYFLRNAYEEKWDLYLRTESEDIHLSSFPDYFFSMNYPLIQVFTPQNFGDYETAPSKCTIKTNSVETFDGVKFDYELSNCWTVGSVTSDLDNVFLIRKPQSPSSKIPDIKFILFDYKKTTEIEFSNNELKINGTVADRITGNENDAMVVIEENFIYKKGSTYIILYAPYITALERLIIRRDRIQFLKRDIGEKINGVCGNGDGEAYPEFYGPKHCLHRSSQVFVESWTGQSDNCDAAALANFRERADTNQLSCREPGVADIKMNSRCLVSGWKVMKLDDEKKSYCITAAPLPSCTQSCDISKEEKIKVTYKCWPKEEAPELVVKAIENKVEIVSHSTVATPSFYHRSSVRVATLCKELLL